jgi:hypothetical protein
MPRLVLLCWLSLIAAGAWAADEGRFIVTWKDGTRTSAAEIDDWGAATAKPALAGRAIFDEQNPARLIVDIAQRRHRIDPPYIELQGGDRLAGRIVEFRAADDETGTPSHFLFEPGLQFDLPSVFARPQIRVREAFVQRIVAKTAFKSGKTANWLLTVHGSQESFRSSHWKPGGITVLTAGGVKQFDFAELAVVDLDRPNNWNAWLRQLATLSPALDSPFVRMELSDGSQLTTSLERLRPVTTNSDKPDHWFHLCQPAWSLDLLSVNHRQVCTRAIFDPLETPLASIEPLASRGQGILLPYAIPPHVNESLAGGVLRLAGNEVASGFAVHAPYQLDFDLPPSARRFHATLALDPSVGSGGCAKGIVQASGKTIFTSPLLIGSSQAVNVNLEVGRRMSLIADAALDDRPTGADPFDIRDHLNWIEPLVEHEPDALRRAVQQKLPLAHCGFEGWAFDPAEAGNWRLINKLDTLEAATGGYRQLIALDGAVTFSRPISPQKSSALQISFGRAIASDAVKMDIWLDSNRILRTTLPEHEPISDPLHVEVPLEKDLPESALLTIRLSPAVKSAVIDWGGLRLAP